MKNDYNVLILPAGSGMAVSAIQALKSEREDKFNIISADINYLAPGLYLADKSYILPRFDDKNFYEKLSYLLKKEKIDVVIPALDTILLEFSKKRKWFEYHNAKIIISDLETIEITRDKWATYNLLKNKVCLPKSAINVSEIDFDFPYIIKPRDGSGSINVFKIRNKKELDFFFDYVPNPIIQEFLGGKEYTVDCFVDRRGKLRLSIARLRMDVKAGISVKGYVIENDKLTEMAKKISSILKFNGPFFFQAIEDDNGIPKLTEINARISGTMSLSCYSGPNIHALAIKDILGETIRIPEILRDVFVTRYWENIYLQKCDIKNRVIKLI